MAPGFWEQIKEVVQIVIALGFVLFTAYYLWKNSKNTAKSDAIKAYQDVIDAYTLRMKEFEISLNELKAENKDLQAQVNQLIGENKALRNVKPSAAFEESVTKTFDEMKAMRADFTEHSSNDDLRFGNIVDLAKANNEMLQKLLPAHA